MKILTLRDNQQTMTQQKFIYEEKFPKGTNVKIASRMTLEDFLRTWRYHHKLETQQLAYADKIAEVESVGFYHGGDVIYKLKDVPGIWHQHLLSPATNSNSTKGKR